MTTTPKKAFTERQLGIDRRSCGRRTLVDLAMNKQVRLAHVRRAVMISKGGSHLSPASLNRETAGMTVARKKMMYQKPRWRGRVSFACFWFVRGLVMRRNVARPGAAEGPLERRRVM